jgi:hypothetical protein
MSDARLLLFLVAFTRLSFLLICVCVRALSCVLVCLAHCFILVVSSNCSSRPRRTHTTHTQTYTLVPAGLRDMCIPCEDCVVRVCISLTALMTNAHITRTSIPVDLPASLPPFLPLSFPPSLPHTYRRTDTANTICIYLYVKRTTGIFSLCLGAVCSVHNME